MKRTLAVLINFLLISLSLQAQERPQLNTDIQKISYIIGYSFGTDLKKEQIEMDTTIFLVGITDALSGKTSLLPDSTMRKMYMAFSEEMNAKKMMMAKSLADKNKKDADSVLAQNSIKDSVVALPNGLQYKILRAGTGPKPTLNDTVICHYRGYFTDGKEFDNSYLRGEPAMFRLKGVIKGWTEALQLMSVGSQWRLWIPPALGYGERGYQNVIEPNALLMFEVELLDVRVGPPPAPQPEEKATPKKDETKKNAKKETKKKK
jgi:FKBP-type peptidyl-prolyl cis-trans isomerase FklB